MFEKQDNYIQLRNEFATGTVPFVLFTGAGFCSPFALPNWEELRRLLVDRLERDVANGIVEKGTLTESITKQLREEKNLWLGFELIKKILPPRTYEDVIRSALGHDRTLAYEIPDRTKDLESAIGILKELVRLNISGVVTTNIDRVIEDSFTNLSPRPKRLGVRTGRDLKGPLGEILRGVPWLVKLHGSLEDTGGWVFTARERDDLLASEGYRFAIQKIFTDYRVIFVGANPDDEAVRVHIETLKKLGVSPERHYWITSREGVGSSPPASDFGIAVIRVDRTKYANEIRQLFEGLRKYEAREKPASSVVPSVAPEQLDTRWTPEDILLISPQEARLALSKHAAWILTQHRPQEANEREYHKFLNDYAKSIHYACYLRPGDPKDGALFEYQLDGTEIGGGAFGRVFKALNQEGTPVAIKVLHENARNRTTLLNTFRQGVQSLKILNKHGVPGVVRMMGAFEIPPSIIMEFVDGINLEQLIFRYKQSLDIIDKCLLLRKIWSIIREAHQLPEEVIHRDLRPANIMLRNSTGLVREDDVVVLDFDLSWFRGAVVEDNVVNDQYVKAIAYYAPEFRTDAGAGTSKMASIDVYGFGMVAFFLLCGRHPLPSEPGGRDWISDLENLHRSTRSQPWQSLGARQARLIEGCTEPVGQDRYSTDTLTQQLDEIWAIANAQYPETPLFLLEELAYRSFGPNEYQLDEDLQTAEARTVTGITMRLAVSQPQKQEERIELRVGAAARGDDTRRRVGKHHRDRFNEIMDELQKSGWRVDRSKSTATAAEIVIRAFVSLRDDYVRKVPALAKALGNARSKLSE